MPKLGAIEIFERYRKRIWCACEECGKERWVQLIGGEPVYSRCFDCAPKGKYSGRPPSYYKTRYATDGYLKFRLDPLNPYLPMADKSGIILEHRYVMAKHLGRCLKPWEVVHHKNGVKTDNEIGNLELLPNAQYHLVDNALRRHVYELEKRVTLLEAENVMLKQQLDIGVASN